MKKRLLFIMLTILIAASNSYGIPISADTANSTEGFGNFTGSFNYSSSSDNAAQIIVKLTNTSPVGNGGYLTAFAFNNPFNAISDVTLSGNTSGNFDLLGATSFDNSAPAPPWGYFDIGASSTKIDWLGGGDPTGGIGVGDTETFTFDLVGAGLNLLTTQDFINELSTTEEYWFGARFRGFENDESDKVPGVPVPEPSTMLLLGTGLAGFIFSRRKL